MEAPPQSGKLSTKGLADLDRPALAILSRLIVANVVAQSGCVPLMDEMLRTAFGNGPRDEAGGPPIDLEYFIRKLRLEPCWCRGATCVVPLSFSSGPRFE